MRLIILFNFLKKSWTPLHYACQNKELRPELLSVLIDREKGASTNIADFNGSTPLHYACQNKKITIIVIKYLIERGSNPFKRNREGKSSIDLAKLNNSFKNVRILNKKKKNRLLI